MPCFGSLPDMQPMILPGISGLEKIETYEANGGYAMLRKALTMQPAEIVDEIKKSNLRGRAGAGVRSGVDAGEHVFRPASSGRSCRRGATSRNISA